jgi:hypothetical protein
MMKKLVLLLFICLLITGCGSKESKEIASISDFESIGTNSGFNVQTNLTRYEGIGYITESALAKYGDDIEIEMVVYTSSDYASQAQEQQIESFNLLKSTGAFVEKEKGANYYDYALISNSRYMVSTRIDNTLIFTKVKLENRELVETFINSLGY